MPGGAIVALLVSLAGCGDASVDPALRKRALTTCDVGSSYAGNADPGTAYHLGGRLLRWRSFPVRVAIDSATLELVTDRAAWEAGIALGIQAWEVASDSSIGTAVIVADTSAADIVVRLSPFLDDDCFLLNCLGVVAEEAEDRYLTRVRLFLFPDATTWSRDKVAQITAHEMGHALGVLLHSEEPSDLMYAFALPVPSIDSYPWITERDLNTMKVAYCMP